MRREEERKAALGESGTAFEPGVRCVCRDSLFRLDSSSYSEAIFFLCFSNSL